MDSGRFPDILAGRYEIQREIGRGGMATVYLANDRKHDRLVAVKMLAARFADPSDNVRFQREIAIVAGLQHPHIVPLFDSGEANGELFFVMPFIEGESLRRRIDREGPLPLPLVARVTARVAEALDYAHERHVIHRDIKPSNILLSNNIAVVADFGIARAAESGRDATLTAAAVVGTPAYMSPEHADPSGVVAAPSDRYALGCVVYEMLTGRPPFPGPTFNAFIAQHCLSPVPSVRMARPEVPEAVDSALQRLMAKDPTERFSTAGAFHEALDAALAGVRIGRRKRTSQPVAGGRRGSHLWRSLIAAAVIAGGALLGSRGWRILQQRNSVGQLSPDVIAVAPFEITDASDELWRNGMVDILSRNYDGVGPLRTVPPTTVIRAWSGRPDTVSAAALARRTGAGYVVFGLLLRSGPSGMQCNLTLFNARNGQKFEAQIRGDVSRVDELADSITSVVLRRLRRDIPTLARLNVGTRSLPALKLFLQGEEAYRRNDYATAQPLYEQAIGIDSSFALAYRRMRGITRLDEWDPTSLAWGARAGALNHGLSPRDSLLVLADSLAPLTNPFQPGGINAAALEAIGRRMAVLQEAARRYPDDPEVWYDIGEMRVHSGGRLPNNDREQALRAFERSLTLDSAFAQGYFHAIELSAELRGPEEALRLARTYLDIDPSSGHTRLMAAMLAGNVTDQRLRELADTIEDPIDIRLAGYQLRLWNDSSESAARIYRHVLERQDTGSLEEGRTRNLLRLYLLRRGRLEEARRYAHSVNETGAGFFVQLALAGVISRDSADRTIDSWTEDGRSDRWLVALTWWGARGDTVRLNGIRKHCQRELETEADGSAEGLLAGACVTLAGAHAALARGDSSTSARLFALGSDSVCGRDCARSRLVGAALLRQRGDPGSSARLLDRSPPGVANGDMYDGLWSIERARTAERLNDLDRARSEYAVVLRIWSNADPQLRPLLDEARAALRRLRG